MSDLGWSDREIADALEGLLEPEVADAFAAEVATDAALAARQAALADVLREPVRLPELTLPGGLAAATQARLAALPRDLDLALALEGELPGEGADELLARDPRRTRALRGTLGEPGESLPELAPPPGAFARVFARLEAEGLVAPAPALASHEDEELADYLEGALEPALRAALERDLGRDASLRARLERLRALLPSEGPSPLPALELPASLADAVGERLREEALLQDPLPEGVSLPIQPPADLLARTLGRLERAELVQPSLVDDAGAAPMSLEASPLLASPAPERESSPGDTLPAPQPASQPETGGEARGELISFWRPLLLAAACLAGGLGLGFLGAQAKAPREPAGPSSELADARAEVRALGRELSEAQATLERERARAEGLAQVGARAQELSERLAEAREGLSEARGRLKAAESSAGEAQVALRAARAELSKGQADWARSEGTLTELRRQLGARDERLSAAQVALRERERELGAARAAREELETQHALARLQVERLQASLTDARSAAPAMRVANAAEIERWDVVRQSWVTLQPNETLPAGAIVRGIGSSSTLQVSGLLPYQLRRSVYVVQDGQRLAPLPRDLWDRRPAFGDEPTPNDVLAWIERLQSPSAPERSRAQQALEARFHTQDPKGTPPTTPTGWSRWWSEAGRMARR